MKAAAGETRQIFSIIGIIVVAMLLLGGSALSREEPREFTKGEFGLEAHINEKAKIVLIDIGSGQYVECACVLTRNAEDWEVQLFKQLYGYAQVRECSPQFYSYEGGSLIIYNRDKKEVLRKELPLGKSTPQEQALAKAWLGDHLVRSQSILGEAAAKKGLLLLRESAAQGCPLGMQNLGSALLQHASTEQEKEEGKLWQKKAAAVQKAARSQSGNCHE